jgi:prephenate dehydrogenase
MTSMSPIDPPSTVGIVGTGLIGTSIGLAAARAGIDVRGWDTDPQVAARAAASAGLRVVATLADVAHGADLVVVCTPIGTLGEVVARVLGADPNAVVTDAGSIKGAVLAAVTSRADQEGLARFVPGHPMGGSERSGPEHASASVVDGVVWAITPGPRTGARATALVEAFVTTIGARPVLLDPDRHDRLVAVVSHLPQVASTALMGLAATEEADEPDILLLAAGGFRDLTRLAASNPGLWSQILAANSEQIVRSLDLYVERLQDVRSWVLSGRTSEVEALFARAKEARLRLATKPQVRAGVAVVQVEIPDEPGALARITAVLGEGGVNIEDLQIVHSPEGGRGTVHVTVGAPTAEATLAVLHASGYDPVRLA